MIDIYIYIYSFYEDRFRLIISSGYLKKRNHIYGENIELKKSTGDGGAYDLRERRTR